MASGTRITRFKTNEHEYVFDGSDSIYLQDWQDNFADGVTDTKRLGGADGGFDNYGDQAFPLEIGNVRLNVVMAVEAEEEMTALLDGIRQMRWWGKGRLYMQPADPDEPERWCWAKCQGLTSAHNFKKHTDLKMPIPINFQVSDPTWYSQGTFPWSWGDGTLWGDQPWGGSALPNACSGTQTDFIIANGGSAPVRAHVRVETAAGQSAENITVQRIVNGVADDEIAYAGVLPENSVLDMNAWTMRVTLNTVNAYTTAFTSKRLHWFTMLPGTNTIRVKMENSGDACSVTIKNYEAWS